MTTPIPAETIELRRDSFAFSALAAGPTDGELVLLLHGFPQTCDAWRPQIAALARAGYRAVAPNQRGYSTRARPRRIGDYVISELVADVGAMADDMGARRFHLVGHDLGGLVAWAFADRHPDRLRSLSVISTPHPRAFVASLPRSLQAVRSGYMGFFSVPRLPETVLGAAGGVGVGVMLRASGLPAAAARQYRSAMATDGTLRAALNWYRALWPSAFRVGRVETPTLYVWSTGDVALGRVAALRTGGHVTGPYTFEVLEGASHWLPETRSDDVTRLLLDHLGSPEMGAGARSQAPAG